MTINYVFFILGTVSSIIRAYRIIRNYREGLDQPTEAINFLDNILELIAFIVIFLVAPFKSLRYTYLIVWFFTFFTPMNVIYFKSYFEKKNSNPLGEFEISANNIFYIGFLIMVIYHSVR